MSKKPSSTQSNSDAATPSLELGYLWEPPAPPTPLPLPPTWSVEIADPVTQMAQELLESDWRLPQLHDLLTTLGFTPEGGTRQVAAQQLAEHFLDPERLEQCVGDLSEEELRYYSTLVVQSFVQSYHTVPQGRVLWHDFTTPWSRLAQRIRKAGLALVTEDGLLYLPMALRQRLPQLQLAFQASSEPQKVLPSNPREILTQIQQLIGILQSEPAKLRAQLRWKAPPYPYAQPITCWPPTPADARKIIARPSLEHRIALLPPDPDLDAEALDAWTQALGCTPERAELLYALLLYSGIILSGSPITIDNALAQQWLTLSPGHQVGALYHLWCSITTWSEWWPLWREQQIAVTQLYHGYWGLNSIDDAIGSSVLDLRGVLLELLACLPHGTWLSVSDLVKWLAALFPTPDTHQYLIGAIPNGPKGGWTDFLEAALLRMFTGPLHAFGLVDVGPSLDAVKAIRLRRLQDLHWRRSMEVMLEAVGELRREALRFIMPESVLEIEMPVPPDLVTFVLQWTVPAGFSRTLVRYRLDVQQLHRAFEHGMDPDALRTAWSAVTGFEPLPEIAEWWDAWWVRYGHVRIYPTQALLQTRDAVTMHEVQVALPGLQSSILGSLTPETVLLDEESVNRLISDLTRQGYMPKEA